jgi:hypothetical protein
LYLLEIINVCIFNHKALAKETKASVPPAGEDNLDEGGEKFIHQAPTAGA